MTNRAPRLLAVLLVGTLVLGACGDDDSDDAADPDETSTSVTTEDVAGDDDDATDDDAPDDDATDDGADDDGAGSFDPAVLAGIDDFCDLDEVGDESFDSLLGPDEEDPAKRKEAYDIMAAFYVRALEIAPSEIKGDVEQMIRGIEPLFDLLEAHDYDFMAVYAAAETDPAVAAQLEALEDPELEAAGERVDDWVEANCG